MLHMEIINEVNRKGGYRVPDNGETFVFDTKVRINGGKNIDKFVIAIILIRDYLLSRLM